MRALGKFLGRLLLLLVILAGGLWMFGPYEPAPLTPSIDTSQISGDMDAYFAAREAAFSDITPGIQKQVVWAGDAGAATEFVVLYIHGFSATAQEIRPVPDRVATDLGANLVYTRLAGHGRGSEAMAEGNVQDWINDVAEALAVARQVGEKIIVMSTSTGGTLSAAAAHDPIMAEGVIGMIFVSPNFGINNPAAFLLTWPGARTWLPWIVGPRRSFEPANEGQATYWTTEYASTAVLPTAAVVKAVTALDHSSVTLPALFWFSDADQVVVPAATRQLAAAWGGPVTITNPELGADDDPYAHVIAGDILSPSQNDAAVTGMLEWIKLL